MATQKRLPARQRIAISALLAGDSVTEAARRAGVTRGCCSRWLNRNERFKSALQREIEVRFSTLKARLPHLARQASDLLSDGLHGSSPIDAAKLSVAQRLLADCLKYFADSIETHQLAEQVRALEVELARTGRRPAWSN